MEIRRTERAVSNEWMRRTCRLFCALCLGLLSSCFAVGQGTPAYGNTKPQTAVLPGAGAPTDLSKPAAQPHTLSNIAQRPYTAILPAPLYPSTPRKQSQFIVQYVYNYAESTYTPAVNLPLLSRAAVKRDTPEGVITAFYSALRSGDYEAWLQCWDTDSRKALEERTKQQKAGAEFWRALWRQYYAGKRFVLIDRIETVNYIILDTQIEDPAKPASRQMDTQVLVNVQGQWFISNAFTNDGLTMNFDPSARTAKVTKEFEIAPVSQLVGPASLTGQAQKEFLAHHTASSALTRTVE